MPFPDTVSEQARRSLAGVKLAPYWLDRAERPPACAPLSGEVEADLAVVGAGFSGLWTAYLARQRFPDWKVVLLECDRVAEGATGRNGGFVSASLTHGIANGMARWPEEMPELVRLGQENIECIDVTVREEGIDCDFLRSGEMVAAVEDYQVANLERLYDLAADVGAETELLDADDARALVDSPTYRGALLDRRGVAMADPARLAWGLADACRRHGVVIHEGTPVRDVEPEGHVLRLSCDGGSEIGRAHV